MGQSKSVPISLILSFLYVYDKIAKNKKEIEMKAKILLKTILIILLLTVIGIILYFYLADIESKVPKEMKEKYNVAEEQVEGRKVFIISPNNSESEKVILYFHGGSYVAEVSNQHWEFIGKLVSDTGATVIVPDYPLTPKYTYKDVFEMVQPLYTQIIEKVKSENLIVMGDSAGGGLALALMEKNGEEGIRNAFTNNPNITMARR